MNKSCAVEIDKKRTSMKAIQEQKDSNRLKEGPLSSLRDLRLHRKQQAKIKIQHREVVEDAVDSAGVPHIRRIADAQHGEYEALPSTEKSSSTTDSVDDNSYANYYG